MLLFLHAAGHVQIVDNTRMQTASGATIRPVAGGLRSVFRGDSLVLEGAPLWWDPGESEGLVEQSESLSRVNRTYYTGRTLRAYAHWLSSVSDNLSPPAFELLYIFANIRQRRKRSAFCAACRLHWV